MHCVEHQDSPLQVMPRVGSSTSSLSSQSAFNSTRASGKRGFTSLDEDDDTPTKRSKDVADMLYADEDSVDTWSESPLTANVHLCEYEAERVLQLCLQPEACNRFVDRGRLETSSTCLALSSLSPGDLPASTALSCCTQPAEAADTDILDTFRKLCAIECQVRPDPHCLDNHSAEHGANFIDQSMRAIVISWLIEVASEFALHQETLFLATALLDRFLSVSKALPRSSLQLLSVACMLIACKHEEERYPSVQAFTNIADNCFRARDLTRMEGLVLQSLEFRVNTPTCYTFLSLLNQHLGPSPAHAALSVYLLEISMLDYELVAFSAPLRAAAAFVLASAADGSAADITAAVIQALLRQDRAELRACCSALLSVHRRAFDCQDESSTAGSPYTAAKDKYRDCAWHCVSHVIPLDRIPEGLFNLLA